MTPKTFPLRVDQQWLDSIDQARDKLETKHEFVLKAVQNEIIKRKEDKKNNA